MFRQFRLNSCILVKKHNQNTKYLYNISTNKFNQTNFKNYPNTEMNLFAQGLNQHIKDILKSDIVKELDIGFINFQYSGINLLSVRLYNNISDKVAYINLDHYKRND